MAAARHFFDLFIIAARSILLGDLRLRTRKGKKIASRAASGAPPVEVGSPTCRPVEVSAPEAKQRRPTTGFSTCKSKFRGCISNDSYGLLPMLHFTRRRRAARRAIGAGATLTRRRRHRRSRGQRARSRCRPCWARQASSSSCTPCRRAGSSSCGQKFVRRGGALRKLADTKPAHR